LRLYHFGEGYSQGRGITFLVYQGCLYTILTVSTTRSMPHFSGGFDRS